MATFQVLTTYDMSNPPGLQADALSGVVSQNSPTGFTVTYRTLGGSTQWVTTVTGSGFTYAQANGQFSVLSGTIASEVANDGTQNVYSLTGAAVDVITDGNLTSGAAELSLWLAGGGVITGSSGNDSLVDYAGNHTITGGGGTDRVIFSGVRANFTITTTSTGYTVRDNVGSGGTDTLNGIAYLKFSDGYFPPANQTITGTAGNDTLAGGFGDDVISGGGGTDTITFVGPSSNYAITPTATGYRVADGNGVDGTDTLSAISFMRFADQTISFVAQTITATSLNEILQGGHGNDTIQGMGGHDLVVFTGPRANYTILGDASGRVVRDNVGLDGTDSLFGVSALQFSDQTVALPYTLTGGTGNDTLTGGYGDDVISGGGGTDTVVFSGAFSGYTFTQTTTGYTVKDNGGVDGTDTLTGISSIRFSDQTISLVGQTINGTSGDDTLASGHGNDAIYGTGGRDTVVFTGPRENYAISGSSSGWLVKDNVGLDGTDTLFNISSLQFTDQTLALVSDLILTGAAGDDTLTGGQGNDALDGGAGSNTAAFAGSRLHYTVTKTASGYTVRDNVGTDGTDTLSNIQTLQFSDGKQNLSIAADAATITPSQLNSLTEIYIAYFNRVPEAAGLDYWISQVRGGMSLNAVGNSFYVAAVSYSSLTGYSDTMTDTAFITKIYQNVLGRSTPDDIGLGYWLAGLAPGGGQTRGSLVNTILTAAHEYKGDPVYGPVADLLDNKLAVGKYNAVTAGVDYLSSDAAITQGMAVSAAVTSTDTSAAINLIGLSSLVPFAG